MTTGEWWAYGSAVVVLISVVGETVADLTDWIKSKDLKKKIEKYSAMVLIVGLTGDVFSIRLTQIATAALNVEAARANERAVDAKDSAVAASKAAERANHRADDAKASADGADGAAKRAGLQAKDAEQRAANIAILA